LTTVDQLFNFDIRVEAFTIQPDLSVSGCLREEHVADFLRKLQRISMRCILERRSRRTGVTYNIVAGTPQVVNPASLIRRIQA
jgi:hypothetical protein